MRVRIKHQPRILALLLQAAVRRRQAQQQLVKLAAMVQVQAYALGLLARRQLQQLLRQQQSEAALSAKFDDIKSRLTSTVTRLQAASQRWRQQTLNRQEQHAAVTVRQRFSLVLQELAQLPRGETAAATLQVSFSDICSALCNHGRFSWSDWHRWAIPGAPGMVYESMLGTCHGLHVRHAVCD